MSYQKHFAILSSGQVAWKKWRLAYADVQGYEPDLHAAQLCKKDLQGADLHRADLTEADLREADLHDADLQETDLRHADLRHANLSDADLRNANLLRANLEGAEIHNADFRGAELHDINMAHALHTAYFDERPIIEVDRKRCGEEGKREYGGELHLPAA